MRLKLKKILDERGITQTAFAAQVNLSEGYISNISQGKKRPAIDKVERIAAALDISVRDLIEDEEATSGATGFSESEATPFVFKDKSPLSRAVAALSSMLTRAETYRVGTSDAGLAIYAGDLLVLELKHEAQTGDMVVANLSDTQTDTHRTVVRQYVPGWLVGGGTAPQPLASETVSIGIIGVVKHIVRSFN